MQLYRIVERARIQITASIVSGLALGAYAIVSPSTDANLENWAAKRIAERPGLPPPEMRSQPPGSLSSDPIAVTLLLLDKNASGARVNALAT